MSRRLLNGALAEMSANPEQLSAVNARGHCVVLAGPGSGKTRTLTTAIARTVIEDVEEPRAVACLTYNNECVAELESRLSRLGIDTSDRVAVSTVHGFALKHVILPYGPCVWPGFRVLSIATKAQMDTAVAAAFVTTGIRAYSQAGLWKKAGVKRRQDLDRNSADWMGRSPDLARLIEAYEASLRSRGLIDIEDMPLLALRLVRENAWVRRALSAKFPCLFVDEYQDLGPALHDLVLELCFRGNIRLFAVGDPDQSIYGFTGADPTLLQGLVARSDVTAISLPFNYRCGTHIIDASNVALGQAREYAGPAGAPAGTISFDFVDGDLAAQATHVINTIVPAHRTAGVELGQIGILYREADHGTAVATAATTAGVPFVRADNKALVPRGNRVSRFIECISQWVTGGWREANPTFRHVADLAGGVVFGGHTSSTERLLLEQELVAFLHRTINYAGSTHEWLKDFRDTLGSSWRGRARATMDDWGIVDTMIERTDVSGGGTDLLLPVFSGRSDATGRLNLSTLHSSKGREFDVVVLFNMNRGVMPSSRDEESAISLIGARRLFYVGVTRARRQLHFVFRLRNHSPWVADLYRRGRDAGWAVPISPA
jgi:DNA helicase-2/ATP-dependent DNA helicase PcrA